MCTVTLGPVRDPKLSVYEIMSLMCRNVTMENLILCFEVKKPRSEGLNTRKILRDLLTLFKIYTEEHIVVVGFVFVKYFVKLLNWKPFTLLVVEGKEYKENIFDRPCFDRRFV